MEIQSDRKVLESSLSGTRLGGQSLLLAQAVWIAIAVLNVGLFLAAIPAEYAAHLRAAQEGFRPALEQFGVPLSFFAGYRTFLDVLQAGAFALVGVLIFRAKPNDWMVMLVSMACLTFGSFFVPTLIQLVELNPVWKVPVGFLRAVGLALSLIALYYLFPDGRFVPGWMKYLAAAWVVFCIIWFLYPQAPANLVYLDSWLENLALSFIIFFGWFGSGIYSQIYRFRRVSGPEQRQQTKWVVLGVSAAFAGFVLYYLPLVLVPGLGQPGVPRLLHIFFAIPVYHALVFLGPLSIAIAILRYRLWDIDLLINRSLVISVLSVLLGVMYFGSVILLQQIFRWITRQESDLAVVITTLAIVAVFNPLRRRVQNEIDRRFYPDKYKAAQILADFSTALHSEVDLTRLTERLEDAAWEIAQPAHVLTWMQLSSSGYSVYIANDDSQDAALVMEPSRVEIDLTDPLVATLRASTGVVDLDRLVIDSPALHKLKSAHVRLIVPMIAQGELMGWISMGPSLSKGAYSAEDRMLLANLSNQAAPSLRIAQLVKQQQEHLLDAERQRHEMQLARTIQQTLLPRDLPELAGWEMAVHYQPARAVGGDFYDYLRLPDGRVAIILGDVSDKGVPAALVMASIRSILRGAAKRLMDPAIVLERSNELIYPEIPPTMFATCLYALLDPETGRLRYANAGQNLPYRRCNGRVSRLEATGMPLGLMPNITYDEHETTLEPGEFMLLYSDGLVEAHNAWQDMFGSRRIEGFMLQEGQSCRAMVDDLLAELRDFTGPGWEQEDDVTLMVLKRLKDGGQDGA